MEDFLKRILGNTILRIWTIIDVLFLFVIIPFDFIISKDENKISGLSFLCFEIIVIFVYNFFIRHIEYRSEISFEIFTIFCIVGSIIGIGVIIIQMIEDIYRGSLTMFFMINILFINVYEWLNLRKRKRKRLKDRGKKYKRK
jgi:FlaA1/EpsC-like NDP-sugar epimerase